MKRAEAEQALMHLYNRGDIGLPDDVLPELPEEVSQAGWEAMLPGWGGKPAWSDLQSAWIESDLPNLRLLRKEQASRECSRRIREWHAPGSRDWRDEIYRRLELLEEAALDDPAAKNDISRNKLPLNLHKSSLAELKRRIDAAGHAELLEMDVADDGRWPRG